MCLSPGSAARGAASPCESRAGQTLVPAAQGDACRPAWCGFAAGAGAAERESQIHAVCAGLGRGAYGTLSGLQGLAIGAGLLRVLGIALAALHRGVLARSHCSVLARLDRCDQPGLPQPASFCSPAPLQAWGLGPPARERCPWLGGAPRAAVPAGIQVPRAVVPCERPSGARCGRSRARREGLLAYRDHPGARTPPDGLDPDLFR